MNLAEEIYQAALSADVLLYLKDGQLAYKAPSSGVPDALRQRIVQHKADIAAFLLAELAVPVQPPGDFPPLVRATDRTSLPVSRAQQRVWFAQQQSEDGSHFNIQGCFAFDGSLDYVCFERAIGSLLQRHEVLRTTFVEHGGTIARAVQSLGTIPFSIIDLSAHDANEQAAEVRALIATDLEEPFDLSRDALLRVSLLHLSPQRHVAIFNMHHIASDGWTVGLLVEEFCRNYAAYVAGGFLEEAVDTPQYADFAAWQEEYLQGDVLETGLSYWNTALDGVPQVHSLPIDKQRPPRQTFEGELYRTCVDRQLSERIRGYCQARKATLFMFLETAFAVLLSQYGSQRDIVVGTPVAGRVLPESESVVGLFINTVVLRCQVDPAQSFDALLDSNKSAILSAFANQHVPFELVVERLGHRRSQSYSPVFQCWFVLQNNKEVRFALPDCTVSEYTDLPPPAAKYELNLYAREASDGDIHLEWVFNSDIFDSGSTQYVAQEFLRLLQCVVDAPERACCAHDIFVAPATRPEGVYSSPPMGRSVSMEGGVLSRILEHVAQNEHRAAVVTDEASYTYGELDRLSKLYADVMNGSGTRGQIGLLMGRGVDIVAAMLAALRLGRTYVPLDVGYPQARLRYMIEHSQCDLIVWDASNRELAERLAGDAVVVGAPEPSATYTAPRCSAQDSSPAYILYTSGSTGHPKGVFQSHAGLAYHADSYALALGLSTEDKILQLASYNFDASVLDTYGALIAGASVHLADARTKTKETLSRLIRERGITVYHSTPTVFKYLYADASPEVTRIRCVVLGGEPIDSLTMQIFRRAFGHDCRLIGLYGATESSLTTFGEITWEQIDAQLRPRLGLPVSETQLLVRRPDGTPARIFEPGEIVIRSAHLALGYWNAPELTALKFRNVDGGKREYATGDAGYLMPDGDVRFVGRLDLQVKVNGIRIELGEIESTMHQLCDVAQAAAIISHDGDDESDATLVACVASRSVLAEQDPSTRADCEQRALTQLRSHLKHWLPDYMVPGRFVFLDRLPQTPSGKIDRCRLLEMLVPVSRTAATAPRDELERRLAELWCQALNVEVVGMQDDFFLLGGHSLKAMRLLAAIEQAFGTAISMKDFFDKPSVEGCAEQVRSGGRSLVQDVTLPRVESDVCGRYEPFPLTLIQEAYWLGRSDVFELGSVSTQSYVEVTVPDLCLDRLSRAFNRLIARHEMLRAVVTPTGEQAILESVPEYVFALIDLRDKSPDEAAELTDSLREEMARQVLPIDTWPVFDVRVSRLPNGSGRLHIVTDAITLDAKSRSVLANELSALYEHEDHELPPLRLSFRDYVLAAQCIGDTPAYATSRTYWLDRLDRLPAAPDLPMAATPGQDAVASIRRWHMTLDRTGWGSLKSKSAQHRLTPANVLLTAFAEVLALWSKTSHFCVNLTLFNRHALHEQVNDIAGVFTSSILLEVNLDRQAPFATQVAFLQDQLWSDIEHRHFSGIEVLRELNSRRGMALAAQMPVVFTSTIGLSDDAGRNSASFAPDDAVGASLSRTSQVFLDCQVAEEGGEARIVWNGMEALFPPQMLDDMFSVFRARVEEIVRCPGLGLPDTQVALPPAHQGRRDAVNATTAPRAAGVLLHQLFARQVAAFAEKPAVTWRGGALTYAELDRLSTALAHRVRAAGVCVNELVAVVAEKGWEQVVAVLAVLKAGGAYLPIDPKLPDQRRIQLLEQAEVAVALTQAELKADLEWPERVRCIRILREELACGEHEALADVQSASDLAYVIFTSGSTGVPKGVMIDHRGAVNTIEDINRRFAVTDQDAVLALSALNFDLSVYDIFGLLAVGGTIVFPQAALERDPLEWTRLVETCGVTIWNTVPALAQMWMDSLDERPVAAQANIRVVMMSGDWIPTGLPGRIRKHFPGALQYSLGGATEASIWSIYYPITDVEPSWSSIPYGRPMQNQTFQVKKPDFRDCPEWVPGDLYIGGIGLAKGYWKDSRKTDAAFVVCPRSGERLYKTGDVGRYLPDGNIEFLGREDNQVKVNGYRIELGDIEAAIVKHPKVKIAIAVAVGERHRKQLVAYVVLEDAVRRQLHQSREELDALSAEVQQMVRDQLPAYMLPAAFVLLEDVPLTANGKVDRKALPPPEIRRESATPTFLPPTNEVEAALCEMWQQQLRLERVGIGDNFFELGGDSLMASRTVGMIRNRFGLGEQFRIRSFFEAPTVQAIAANVSACLDVLAIEATLKGLSNACEEVEDGLI